MSDSTRDIREERRWFYARLRRFASGDGTVPYEVFIRSPGGTLDDLDDFPAGYTDRVCLCLYDRGESILQPGQIAVSREDLLLAKSALRGAAAVLTKRAPESKLPQAYLDLADRIETQLTSPAADQQKPCEVCNGEGMERLATGGGSVGMTCSKCHGTGSDPAREGGSNA